MSTAITSASTYLRAFSASSDIKAAAGNYQYKTTTKITISIISVLTLGIAYGILKLMEKLVNPCQKKIDQFCINAPTIQDKLSDAVLRGEDKVMVRLADGQEITFEQHDDPETKQSVVIISDGKHSGEVAGTLEEICVKLENDFTSAPGYYRINQRYQRVVDKQTATNTLEAQKDAIPGFNEFAMDSANGAEAKAKRVAAANHKFNQHYPAPDPDARNPRIRFQTE